ncbi:MAG: protein-disulfide reductase DsbD [Lysobacteraceae bacterium]
MNVLLRCLLLLPLLLLSSRVPALDESDLLPIDEAFQVTAQALDAESVEVHWQITEGYYLYRHRISVLVDGEGVAGELSLPNGEAKHDEFFGDVETYRGSLTARLDGASGDAQGKLRLKVRYQGCADVGICYPPHQKILDVALPQTAANTALQGLPPAPMTPQGLPFLATPQPVAPLFPASTEAVDRAPLPEDQAFKFEAIAIAADELLMRFTPAKGYYLYQDRSSFRVLEDDVQAGNAAWPQGSSHRDEHFGEVVVYFDEVEVPLRLARNEGTARRIRLLASFQGCQTDGICYPPMTRTLDVDLPAGTVRKVSIASPASSNKAPASLDAGGWLLALLGAFMGGVVLNLMPCVLPVLSFKAIGLAKSGESHAKARAHALWYTAGVLASFIGVGLLAIGLRAAGQALGWGFQLQQPVFVAAVVYVMFAVGLSLSGVVSFGAGLAGSGQSLTQRSGPAGDFFTGVLAVVVASPCTAPFMGPALALAFASSSLTAMSIFIALGLGLALPFLLIGFVPALAQRLPKPGAWMDTLKQILAFPMYLTAIWLLWVLINQRGADAGGLVLIGLTTLAAGLWWWERQRYGESTLQKMLAALLILAALIPLWQVWRLPALQAAQAQAESLAEVYSAERLATLRAEGKPVFVNMTADWCATCKLNESRVLARDAFQQAIKDSGTVYLKGDWTNVDPAITAFLDAHGAVGVPLYVMFRPGDAEGRVLPTLLTEAEVLGALQATASPASP